MNGLTWLLRLDLPSGTVRLSDGGVTIWGADEYRGDHPVIGSIAQIGEITAGTDGELPEQEIVIAPPSNAALDVLQAGAVQRSAMRLWLAEFDPVTGAVAGTPELYFAGKMDRLRRQFALRQLQIVVSGVPETEVLLFSDDGNGLSAEFHKSTYPGETGHDQASELALSVAWGTTSGRSGVGGVGGSGGGGAGGNLELRPDFL